MGALGKDRVFVAIDKSTDIKVPSDFAGITLVFYDGSRVSDKDGAAAVREACDLIARAMREPRYQELVGEWCSRYAKAADLDHGEVIDDLDITAIPGGIHFSSKPVPGAEPYTADGRIFENQITGNWKHRTGHTFAEGVFVLVVNPMANAMYGYSSARTETGAMIYETWTFAKKTGSDLKTVKGTSNNDDFFVGSIAGAARR